MKRVLCIIDMQSHFEAAKDEDTVAEVCKQIRRARRYSWPILLVEYKGCGRSHKDIMASLKGYKRCYRITKRKDDGAEEVMGKVIAKGIDPWFRICGVNSGACVAATTFTLLEAIEGCKVELVYEGCNTDFYYEDESRKRKVLRDLRKIKGRRKNVKII